MHRFRFTEIFSGLIEIFSYRSVLTYVLGDQKNHLLILLPSAESFKKGCCQLQAKVCARSTG